MSNEYTDDFGMDVDSGNGTIAYIAEDGITQDIVTAVKGNQEIANIMDRWSRSLTQGNDRPTYDLFNRNKFSANGGTFDVMANCAAAVENDEVLSTLADTTEGIAFQKMTFEMNDEDQADVWNQIARDLDMDNVLRQMWREVFKVSQVYVAVEWNYKEYTVRTKPDPKDAKSDSSKGKGNRKRKKSFNIYAPTALSILDPLKVVPVGNMMFGRERFAYIAGRDENDAIASVLNGDVVDETILRLMERKYVPSATEKKMFGDMGIPADRLWLFKQESVFRHTLTRANYERFSTPRLKSILPLIDLKQRLRESDRASLVGHTNFIVVIRKGTDKYPAKARELEALSEQAKMVARIPVIVGDHRLSVDIISPPIDHTLDGGRYTVLDSRLVFRALNTFSPSLGGGGGMSSSSQVEEINLVVSRGFENRRHLMGRTLEKHLLRRTVDLNSQFDEAPSISYVPRRISLDVNTDIMNAILKLRDRGDLSRETALEELDYDQEIEARRKVIEDERYDEIFQTHVPFDSPNAKPGVGNVDPKTGKPVDTEGGRPKGAKDGSGAKESVEGDK